MKKLLNSLIIVALCSISFSTNAQDLITKKDGSDISAKVLEITTSVIKYKQFDNLSGPTFTMLKSDVLMIRYENGTKDIFNEPVNDVSSADEDTYKVEEFKYFGEKNRMQNGKRIEIIELIDKKERKLGLYIYRQDGQKLKYMSVFNTLKSMDICSENISIARKYRNGALIMAVIGGITFPVGFLILVNPIHRKRQKEFKYVNLAIEDYNSSLK